MPCGWCGSLASRTGRGPSLPGGRSGARAWRGARRRGWARARARVGDPKVLLLDEPLSNLDAKLREDTRLELRELVKKIGITTVYVARGRVEALTMSDVVAVMNEGQIMQEGSPVDIYRAPKERFVANFIGLSN